MLLIGKYNEFNWYEINKFNENLRQRFLFKL